jgi:hypothetical protein
MAHELQVFRFTQCENFGRIGEIENRTPQYSNSHEPGQEKSPCLEEEFEVEETGAYIMSITTNVCE